VTAFCSSGHPQSAAVSAVDGAVRTPGRGSAALSDTGHCRSRPGGRGRTWPPPARTPPRTCRPRRACGGHCGVRACCGSPGRPAVSSAVRSAALVNPARFGEGRADTSVRAGHTDRASRTPHSRRNTWRNRRPRTASRYRGHWGTRPPPGAANPGHVRRDHHRTAVSGLPRAAPCGSGRRADFRRSSGATGQEIPSGYGIAHTNAVFPGQAKLTIDP